MSKHTAFAKQNKYGYWVGCIQYPNGVISEITNAKYTKCAALEIVERVIEGADERWIETERLRKLRNR